jgi:hypothetical protein
MADTIHYSCTSIISCIFIRHNHARHYRAWEPHEPIEHLETRCNSLREGASYKPQNKAAYPGWKSVFVVLWCSLLNHMNETDETTSCTALLHVNPLLGNARNTHAANNTGTVFFLCPCSLCMINDVT